MASISTYKLMYVRSSFKCLLSFFMKNDFIIIRSVLDDRRSVRRKPCLVFTVHVCVLRPMFVASKYKINVILTKQWKKSLFHYILQKGRMMECDFKSCDIAVSSILFEFTSEPIIMLGHLFWSHFDPYFISFFLICIFFIRTQ